MNDVYLSVMTAIESTPVLAPFIFIMVHAFRSLFFIPVAVVCVTGGILFGTLLGSLYSLVGLTLSSIVFYIVLHKFPRTIDKLSKLRLKWFGHRSVNMRQIAVLRLIPFIHYHLLSLCIIEEKKGFKEYVILSLLTNIPLSFLYTIFGNYIGELSPVMILTILLTFSAIVYVLRERKVVIKWKEFFRQTE